MNPEPVGHRGADLRWTGRSCEEGTGSSSGRKLMYFTWESFGVFQNPTRLRHDQRGDCKQALVHMMEHVY